MNKFALIGFTVFSFAAASHAQFEGIGWDNANQEIVGRIGIGGYNHVEAGLGFNWENRDLPGAGNPGGPSQVASDYAMMTITVSGRFLLALHQWEKLTGYLNGGIYFRDDQVHGAVATRRASIDFIGGYQPEVLLLPHFAVSTLFGLDFAVLPDVVLRFRGDPVSIVEGVNFRILF